MDRAPITTRLWTATLDVSFEADNAEDAEAVVGRLVDRVLEHPSTWSSESWFHPEQETETVDV